MQFKMVHENYNVFDLQKSLDFYREALGLTEVRRKEAEDGSYIIVYVGNETEPQFSATLNCSDEVAAVTVTGSGNQFIKICFDGVMDQAQSHYLSFV